MNRKVLLTLQPDDTKIGYENFYPHQGAPYLDLTHFGVDDAELESLWIDGVFGAIPFSELDKAFESYARKLAHGAEIIIEDTDLSTVCRNFTYMSLNLEKFNSYLPRAGFYNLETFKKLFLKYGVNLMNQRLVDDRFYIRGIRA